MIGRDVLLTLVQPDFAGQTRTQTRLGVEGARQIRNPMAMDGLVSPEPRMACAKNVLDEHDAVSEMKVGPSKSVCRSRLQTAVSCFSPKGCGGERYGKSRE